MNNLIGQNSARNKFKKNYAGWVRFNTLPTGTSLKRTKKKTINKRKKRVYDKQFFNVWDNFWS